MKEKLTWKRVPRELRCRKGPALRQLPRDTPRASLRHRPVRCRGSQHDLLQRLQPCLVEVEQAAKVQRAHLDSEFVRELRGVVREQMPGHGDGSVFELVVCRDSVHLNWAVRRVQEEEFVEWMLRPAQGAEGDAILDEGVECEFYDVKRGVLLDA